MRALGVALLGLVTACSRAHEEKPAPAAGDRSVASAVAVASVKPTESVRPVESTRPVQGCAAILTEARAELLRRGFAPTKDTAAWLQVSEPTPGVAELAITMRESADGASTGYSLTVEPTHKGPTEWRQIVRLYQDDHAEWPDSLEELNRKRRRGKLGAEISIVYFRPATPSAVQEQRLFVSVAGAAADRCLAGVQQ